MHRSLLLLIGGLLAVATPTSAIYVEGYERDTFHELTFDVQDDGSGLNLTLVDANLDDIQAGDHLNITVRNLVGIPLQFEFESTWQNDDPVDDGGNVTRSTVLIAEFDVPAANESIQAIQMPNDTLAIRFTASDGQRADVIDHELLMFLAASSGPGGEEPAGSLDDGMGDEEEAKGSPVVSVAILGLALVALAAFVRRM